MCMRFSPLDAGPIGKPFFKLSKIFSRLVSDGNIQFAKTSKNSELEIQTQAALNNSGGACAQSRLFAIASTFATKTIRVSAR